MISSDVSAGNPAQASEYNNLRLDLTPIGTVVPFAAATIPAGAGWLMCYGQAVSRTTYADLFTAIGTAFGVGDGSTTFNVPDLRGRMPLGKDDMGGSSANRVVAAEADTIGGAAGAETITLDATMIPPHTHKSSVTSYRDGSGGQSGAALGTSNTTTGTNQWSTDNGTGGGLAHGNMPPFLTLNYIIKY